MAQQNKGNAAVVILVAIIIVSLLAVLGYFVWQSRHPKPAAQNTANTTNNTIASGASQPVSMSAACSNLTLGKGSSEGTAGTMYWHVVITNSGSYACTLTGYPVAFMTDTSGVSVSAMSNALYTPVAVTLAAHGGKAHAVVALPDPANVDKNTATCTAGASSSLRLYLPGLTTAVEAAFGESACPGFSVTALQPGA